LSFQIRQNPAPAGLEKNKFRCSPKTY